MRYHMTGKSRISHSFSCPGRSRAPRFFACAALVLALFLTAVTPAAAQRGVAVSFLPDAEARLGIEEAASPERAMAYQVYVPSFMAFSRLPGDFNGAVWMRFNIGPAFEKPVGPLRVNLGSSLPGVNRLFIPAKDGGFIVMENAPHSGLFTLAEDMPFPDVLYARIDGVPGLWFRPVLEAAPEKGAPYPLPVILAGLFGLVMLALLLQYIRRAEEWRIWAAITAGCGIVAAFLPSAPAAGDAYAPLMAAAMLMPGLILVFFAHTARHLFDSPRNMPGYDKLFLIYYIAGGLLALLPLVPGFLWSARYLPLSGILLVPLLPAAMVAMSRALRGGVGFFCACLLPIAGVAASAWGLTATDVPLLGGTGGLWGLALGMLVFAFTGPTKPAEEALAEDDVFDSLDRSTPEQDKPAPARETDGENGPDGRDAWTDGLPSLGIAGSGSADAGTPAQPDESVPAFSSSYLDDDFPTFTMIEEDPDTPDPAPAPPVSPEPPAFPEHGHLSAVEEYALAAEEIPVAEAPVAETPGVAVPMAERETVFSPEAETPGQTMPVLSGPADPAALAEAPVSAAFGVSVSRPITLVDDDTAGEETPASAGEPDTASEPSSFRPDARKARRTLFDLPSLVKSAYDDAASLAERKNIGMSWFIAPQTGRLFEGQPDLLDSALRLLLRDMVEAVDRGNIRMNVRRLPESASAGHIVFTIVEWDARQTAHARNMAGLSEAWSIAEQTGGIFSVEHSPSSGTTVIFSSILTPMDKPKAAEQAEAPAPRAEDAPSPVPAAGPEEAPAAEDTAVRVFTDHPDIAVPADIEIPVYSVPAGIDADSLADAMETERQPSRVIVADSAASSRARTASAFNGSPYSVLECTSPPAALDIYRHHPSALLIMNADMPEVDITAAMRDIHTLDEAAGRSPAPLVCLVSHESQAARLTEAGCARALMKPVDAESLLAAALELAPLPEEPAPAEDVAEPAPLESPAEAPTPETVLHDALADIPSVEAGKAEEPEARDVPAPGGIFDAILPEEPAAGEKPEAPVAGQKASAPGFGLLDMIITDEEEETETRKAEPAPAVVPGPARAKVRVKARARAPVKTVVNIAPPKPAVQQPAAAPVEAANPSVPQPAAQSPDQQPVRVSLAAPEPEEHPVEGVDDMTLELRDEAQPAPEGDASSISIPLPGEEDSVFKDMMPLVPGLIAELKDAMRDAAKGREEKSPMLVQEAAERIAGKAESFGLAKLERMARCVERAAAADDIEPMECVLADLESWVARYKDALTKLHRSQW